MPINKVIFISSHTFSSSQWLWFSEKLLNKNIQHLHIIINDTEPILCKHLNDIGIKSHFLKHKDTFSHFKNLFKIIGILRNFKPDVVQTELPLGNLLGLIAAKLLGLKIKIATASNVTWASDYKSTKQNIIDKVTYKLANHIITQTKLSEEYLIEKLNLNPSKITTIWHAIDKKKYENIPEDNVIELKQKYKVANSDFIIGMVARLENWKGHEYGIVAMKSVVEKHPNIKLLIFGEGPEHKKLNDLISSLQLNNNVFLMGFENDIITLYKLFNVQLHVPIDKMSETFGITLIDGMISRCPQVLTKSGIAYYTAKHLENTYIVDYKNSEDISEAIITLYQNESLRVKLIDNNYNLAISLFDVNKKVDAHIDLYNKLNA